jgi:hypothetical protein
MVFTLLILWAAMFLVSRRRCPLRRFVGLDSPFQIEELLPQSPPLLDPKGGVLAQHFSLRPIGLPCCNPSRLRLPFIGNVLGLCPPPCGSASGLCSPSIGPLCGGTSRSLLRQRLSIFALVFSRRWLDFVPGHALRPGCQRSGFDWKDHHRNKQGSLHRLFGTHYYRVRMTQPPCSAGLTSPCALHQTWWYVRRNETY